jgi:hypothetical protein
MLITLWKIASPELVEDGFVFASIAKRVGCYDGLCDLPLLDIDKKSVMP